MSSATIRARRQLLRSVPTLTVVACVAIVGFTSASPWVGIIAVVVFAAIINWRVRVARHAVNDPDSPPTRAVQTMEIVGWAILVALTATIDVLCTVAAVGGGLTPGALAAVILLCVAFTVSAILDGYYVFTLRTGYPGASAPASAASPVV